MHESIGWDHGFFLTSAGLKSGGASILPTNHRPCANVEHHSQIPSHIICVVHNYKNETLFKESGWYEFSLKQDGWSTN